MDFVVGKLEGVVLRLYRAKDHHNVSEVLFGKQSFFDKVTIRRERL